MARFTYNATKLSAANNVARASAVGVNDVYTANAAAITAALANDTISGDGTALGLVTAIQTANDVANVNVSVSIDLAVITTADQLRAVFNEIVRVAIGNGRVTG